MRLWFWSYDECQLISLNYSVNEQATSSCREPTFIDVIVIDVHKIYERPCRMMVFLYHPSPINKERTGQALVSRDNLIENCHTVGRVEKLSRDKQCKPGAVFMQQTRKVSYLSPTCLFFTSRSTERRTQETAHSLLATVQKGLFRREQISGLEGSKLASSHQINRCQRLWPATSN